MFYHFRSYGNQSLTDTGRSYSGPSEAESTLSEQQKAPQNRQAHGNDINGDDEDDYEDEISVSENESGWDSEPLR